MGYKVIVSNKPEDRQLSFTIRRTVFIEEQQVPAEMEIDGHDYEGETRYVLAFDANGAAVGTARFRPYSDGIVKVERVAVLAGERGGGVGCALMLAVAKEAKAAGYITIKLSAQLHARLFYEKLGFAAKGPVYLDAGIEHVDMFKMLEEN